MVLQVCDLCYASGNLLQLKLFLRVFTNAMPFAGVVG